MMRLTISTHQSMLKEWAKAKSITLKACPSLDQSPVHATILSCALVTPMANLWAEKPNKALKAEVLANLLHLTILVNKLEPDKSIKDQIKSARHSRKIIKKNE